MFKEGFYELFSLLEKQKVSTSDATPLNWANRVVIVCSVIARIFNPVQVLDGHISTSFK
jgi:hypothetical protein